MPLRKGFWRNLGEQALDGLVELVIGLLICATGTGLAVAVRAHPYITTACFVASLVVGGSAAHQILKLEESAPPKVLRVAKIIVTGASISLAAFFGLWLAYCSCLG